MIWIFLACIALLMGWVIFETGHVVGYRKGVSEKIPDEKMPCGDRRNPHDWPKWEDYAEWVNESLLLSGKKGVIGIIQCRYCKKCNQLDSRSERTVPRAV